MNFEACYLPKIYRQPELSLDDFRATVRESLNKYELAFKSLEKENEKDKIKVIRVSDLELQI